MLSMDFLAANPLSATGSRRERSPIRKEDLPPLSFVHEVNRVVGYYGLALRPASLIGGRALIVNAVDMEAAAFWRRRGFLPSKDDPLILFRTIADIAASLR